MDIESQKYPIGKFQKPDQIDKTTIENWIATIENFPKLLKEETQHLSEIELEQRYRPNGWTIRQVVNHCSDSHMNSFIRFKLALTEDTPTIKPYFEDCWAELSDSKNISIESSLKILEGLHERWVYLLRYLKNEELEKAFLHPENQEIITLKLNIGSYAWHCQHHLEHVKIAKKNL